MKQEEEQDHGGATNYNFIMCDVCELAPAAATCKADAAALCVACDHDIHSANPLAARHHRVPLNQFDTKTAGSWILGTGNSFADQCHQERKSVDLFSFFDNLISDLENLQVIFSSTQTYDGDGVVPVQTTTLKPPPPRHPDRDDLHENRFETKFTTSNVDFSFLGNSCYTAPSLSHTVSSSSLDVGVVPDGSSLSDITNPFTKPGLSSSGDRRQVATCTAADRKARVLRYKEKRKKRKFEKTIRYASRKAYAVSRPRIKGRFAKRSTDYSDDYQCEYSDISTTAGGILSSNDACYGVVPSFPESRTTCSISNFQYHDF